MSVALIKAAINRALLWTAKRGKGVSKHVSHHTRSAANAAKRNPRYLPRVLGRKTHSIFKDPRPKKLIEDALRNPDKTELRRNVVRVEKQFNRVIGKQGETYVCIWIDARTGRVITAFPTLKSFATVAAVAVIPESAFGESLEERLETTVQGLETIATEWQRTHKKPKEEVASAIIEFLLGAIGLDSTVAGDPDDGIRIKLDNYLDRQSWELVNELQEAAGQTFVAEKQQALHREFRNAVWGAVLDLDEDE
jgi:hypothetical protein